MTAKRSIAGYSRRTFIKRSAAACLSIALPTASWAVARRLPAPVSLGLIADLHQDIMHDGPERMRAFVDEMRRKVPHALVQMGDFAYPKAENKEVIDAFNQAHETTLHVIGNHDTDAGHTREQCLEIWGMPARYYAKDVQGLRLLVLDGNDSGSPEHKGGYPSYVGPEQQEWLQNELSRAEGPVIVLSHQPLCGTIAVDNARTMQKILSEHADKVLLALNGHSHIDHILRSGGVTYMHLNSASYQWVGGDHQHASYPENVHAAHPWIAYTCPYRDSLFAHLTVDPETLAIRIEGRESAWVGPSPAQLGADNYPELIVGEHIAPVIRNRSIERMDRS